MVFTIPVEFRTGHIQPQVNVLAGGKTRIAYGLQDDLYGYFVGPKVGRKTAALKFVCDQ